MMNTLYVGLFQIQNLYQKPMHNAYSILDSILKQKKISEAAISPCSWTRTFT